MCSVSDLSCLSSVLGSRGGTSLRCALQACVALWPLRMLAVTVEPRGVASFLFCFSVLSLLWTGAFCCNSPGDASVPQICPTEQVVNNKASVRTCSGGWETDLCPPSVGDTDSDLSVHPSSLLAECQPHLGVHFPRGLEFRGTS